MYKNFSFSILLFISIYFPFEINQFQFNLWIVLSSIPFGTKLLMFILFLCLFGGQWTVDIGQNRKTLKYFSFRNEICLPEPISKFKWSNELNYCELNQFCWINRLLDYPSIQIYLLFILWTLNMFSAERSIYIGLNEYK